jgi:DNA-binding transcriptional MerR regulator/methylmalonyl-CoA mutase cobalamin-binding subunit
MNSRNYYPIRLAARESGLSTHVIRVWEKRYHAICPQRTEKGHRLYSAEDTEKLRLLNRAIAVGHKISQIAGFTNQELISLLKETIDHTSHLVSASVVNLKQPDRIKPAIQAMLYFDEVILEEEIQKAAMEMSQPRWIDFFLVPFLHQIGTGWERGEIRIAHEHLASRVIRRTLYNLLNMNMPTDEAPLIVLGTLSGQNHEFGALLAAISAQSQGWRALFLGADLPPGEIALAAKTRQAKAVGLSLVYPFSEQKISSQIGNLKSLLGIQFPLLMGGRATQTIRQAMAQAGVLWCDDFSQFRLFLIQVYGNPPLQTTG